MLASAARPGVTIGSAWCARTALLGLAQTSVIVAATVDSGSLSLKPPSSSPLGGSLLRDARALASTALPSWGRIGVASLWIGPASAAVDRVVPLDEGWNDVCRLKPVKRNECCCNGLIIKVLNLSVGSTSVATLVACNCSCVFIRDSILLCKVLRF
jgi:hypothetical protein